jgi:hypothetical protein
MIKKLLTVAAVVFASAPAFAFTTHRYETPCYIETDTHFHGDTCVVIDTREDNGALRTRNIFSNRFSLTIKSWFEQQRGFVTWDSHNKRDYSWSYKTGAVNEETGYSYVMPGVLVKDVPWD